MSLIYKTDTAGGWLALWHATESEHELRALVSLDDVASCAGIVNPKRRIERLAWRALLRELLPGAGEVTYTEAGVPRIGSGYIGASHTMVKAAAPDKIAAGPYAAGDIHAALIFSEYPCAVDVEPFSRDFSRAATRYLSPEETALPAARDPRFNAVAWCAKEVVYKLADTEGVDFARDIRITAVDLQRGRLEATLFGRPVPHLEFVAHGELCIVWSAGG
ncbi:MAG: 4'-phosphopantetheinyl transferase superfamily protein [Rikenellaceae bacterium]|jgi:hypothetical protein|nr:4'-phosphopantetheinyl transferase superfamily protein [Rikenellaceae bacterium]